MINKTTINRLTVIIVLLTVIFSCDGERAVLRADLNLALRLSGENRPELEKIIQHYSTDKKDTLKRKTTHVLNHNISKISVFAINFKSDIIFFKNKQLKF